MDNFDYLEEDKEEVTSVYEVDGWNGATDRVAVKLQLWPTTDIDAEDDSYSAGNIGDDFYTEGHFLTITKMDCGMVSLVLG